LLLRANDLLLRANDLRFRAEICEGNLRNDELTAHRLNFGGAARPVLLFAPPRRFRREWLAFAKTGLHRQAELIAVVGSTANAAKGFGPYYRKC
jgi:hypothetical protein